MTKNEFNRFLIEAGNLSFEFAKRYVVDELPPAFLYTVKLNISTDATSLTQFDLYPADNGKVYKLIPFERVSELLLRKEKVPVWIDISVEQIWKNHTVLQLLCAGRYSADSNEFYYSKQGTGPFGIKSPVFPPLYKDDGSKFRIKKTKTLFSWLTGMD